MSSSATLLDTPQPGTPAPRAPGAATSGPLDAASSGPAVAPVQSAAELRDALRRVDAEMGTVVGRIDPTLVSSSDAAALATEADRIVRRATALRTELLGRAAEAGSLIGAGGRGQSPERWAAGKLGMTPSQAAQEIRTAERLRTATGTRDAFRDGKISADHAGRVAEAVELAPDAEQSLLEAAERTPGQVAGRCRDIKALWAGREGIEARNERHRRKRRLLRSETDDLAARVELVMPALDGARLDALCQPFVQEVVDRARREERFEAAVAHRLDALMLALETGNAAFLGHPLPVEPRRTRSDDGPAGDPAGQFDRERTGGAAGRVTSGRSPTVGTSRSSGGVQKRRGRRPEIEPESKERSPGSGRTTRWGGSNVEVIWRIDEAAVRRGCPIGDERLDVQIAGGPPIPVTPAQVHDMFHHDDPRITLLLTQGTDIMRATTVGRSPTALQKAALKAMHDRCADIDCRSFGTLEIDHLTPWSEGGPTTIDNLAPICGATHDAKTHRGRQLHRIPGSHLVTADPDQHQHDPG